MITELGEEIMAHAEHLNAETYRFLMLVAEFDRLDGHRLHGFSSCAEWLAYSTRVKRVTARERAAAGRYH